MSYLVSMRRHDTSTPWGFRLNGGADVGIPLHVQKITPRSIAQKCGLQVGDGILQIGQVSVQSLSHNGAKMEIIRQGNDLDLVIRRGVVNVECIQVPDSHPSSTPNDITVYYEPRSAHAHNPAVQSKSFKILQQQLSSGQ